jgi:hypothetical protein
VGKGWIVGHGCLSDGSEVDDAQVMVAESGGVVSDVDIVVIDSEEESIVVVNFCAWEVMLGGGNFVVGDEAGGDLLVPRRGKSTNFRAREKQNYNLATLQVQRGNEHCP